MNGTGSASDSYVMSSQSCNSIPINSIGTGNNAYEYQVGNPIGSTTSTAATPSTTVTATTTTKLQMVYTNPYT